MEFASVEQLVARNQVAQLLEVEVGDAERRLSALVDAGLLSKERLWLREPACFRITSAGAEAVASPLTPPGISPRARHALAVGSLWLIASRGAFGAVDRVLSQRQMQSADDGDDVHAPFAARPGEFGGALGLHYPDVMLLTAQGRIAVEFLLRGPEPHELEAVLRAYAADVRMTAVLYVVSDPWVGWMVQSVAARLELSPMVHVQPAAFG